jgi:hypothetical protein
MVRRFTTIVAIAGGLLVGVAAWGRIQRARVESVPYRVLEPIGDVELRRYPSTVRVETNADSDRRAFGRLFRYLAGANETDESIEMTAPVEVAHRSTTISMTAPVEVAVAGDAQRRMSFFLPAEYDAGSAPTPSDPTVDLVAVPERTLAVARFTWRPTDRRIARETAHLLATLADADVETVGEAFFMGYDAPWTLPFIRRNEVAVEVETPGR